MIAATLPAGHDVILAARNVGAVVLVLLAMLALATLATRASANAATRARRREALALRAQMEAAERRATERRH